MPDNSNKKGVLIFVVIFIILLGGLAAFIGYRLYTQQNSDQSSTVDDANKTIIGGNIYCVKPDGTKGMVLNTGKVVITDTGVYPAGSKVQDKITVIPDENGSWSANVDWSKKEARYNIVYEIGNNSTVLANGVKFSDLKSKKAVNCSTPSNIGSRDITNPAELVLKPACLQDVTSRSKVVTSEIKDTVSESLCPTDTDKTSYEECMLNGAATDKKNGYRGFDFTYEGCGDPVSSDVQLKLSTTSVFLSSSDIELTATVRNNSKVKMNITGVSPVMVNFTNTSSYLDSFKINCVLPNGQSMCGKVSSTDNSVYELVSLDPETDYVVTLIGKLKSTLKLQDKLSINVEAKLAPGYLDTNYVDNRATIEKTVIVDGKQCSDTKLSWDQNVCWNDVKLNEDGFYYFDTCPTGETCDLSFKTLTESQLCMYLNWNNASKPSVTACPQIVANATSITTVAPTTSSSSSRASSISSSVTSILTIQLGGTSSSRSSSSQTVVPQTASSRSSSSSVGSTVTTVSSNVSSTGVNEKLPKTAIEPVQIFAWIAIFLIAFGFVSYKFFFKEASYEKIDDIRFELSKKTYLTKLTLKENVESNARKVKWEVNYQKNRIAIEIKKLFDKKS